MIANSITTNNGTVTITQEAFKALTANLIGKCISDDVTPAEVESIAINWIVRSVAALIEYPEYHGQGANPPAIISEKIPCAVCGSVFQRKPKRAVDGVRCQDCIDDGTWD